MKIFRILALSSLVFGLGANAAGITSVDSVTNVANVKGSVTLQARGDIPSNLEDLWAGRDDQVSRKKLVKVEGSYTPNEILVVTESGLSDSVADNEGSYTFNFSVLSVMNSFAQKARASSRKTSVLAEFANDLSQDDDDSDSDSVDSVVSVLNSPINVSETMSVTRLVTIRKGNKGILKGSFSGGSKAAKGRFKLNFTF